MIPVTAPARAKWRGRPSFKCFHCQHEFYVRKTRAKLFCVDCEAEADRQKSRAVQRVKLAIKRGDIQPPTNFSCVDCKKPATCYEHRDYGRVLDVQPICASCNRKRGPAKLGPIYLPRSV